MSSRLNTNVAEHLLNKENVEIIIAVKHESVLSEFSQSSKFTFSTESDNESDDQTNNEKGGRDINVGERGRGSQCLKIAIFHNECGVIISPAVSSNGTSWPTVTPGKHLLCLSVLIEFCWTPGLESFHFTITQSFITAS